MLRVHKTNEGWGRREGGREKVGVRAVSRLLSKSGATPTSNSKGVCMARRGKRF